MWRFSGPGVAAGPVGSSGRTQTHSGGGRLPRKLVGAFCVTARRVTAPPRPAAGVRLDGIGRAHAAMPPPVEREPSILGS